VRWNEGGFSSGCSTVHLLQPKVLLCDSSCQINVSKIFDLFRRRSFNEGKRKREHFANNKNINRCCNSRTAGEQKRRPFPCKRSLPLILTMTRFAGGSLIFQFLFYVALPPPSHQNLFSFCFLELAQGLRVIGPSCSIGGIWGRYYSGNVTQVTPWIDPSTFPSWVENCVTTRTGSQVLFSFSCSSQLSFLSELSFQSFIEQGCSTLNSFQGFGRVTTFSVAWKPPIPMLHCSWLWRHTSLFGLSLCVCEEQADFFQASNESYVTYFNRASQATPGSQPRGPRFFLGIFK